MDRREGDTDHGMLLQNILDQVKETKVDVKDIRESSQHNSEQIAGMQKQLNNGMKTMIEETHKDTKLLHAKVADVKTKQEIMQQKFEDNEETIGDVSSIVKFFKVSGKLLIALGTIVTIIGVFYTIMN